MGCDGGTIPKRDELVRTKKKKEQKDRTSVRVYRWRHCSVSQTPLRAPVVACQLGRLYNKDEIITRLLNKTQEASNIPHIRGLKDVKELQLTPNPAYEGEQQQRGGETVEASRAPWICPVSALEMNGKHSFCFLWTCGCVVAARAIREVKSDVCGKCGAPMDSADVIVLNPSPEQSEEASQRMEEMRRRAKEAKKAKRKPEGEEEKGPQEKKQKKNKVSNGDSSSLTGAAGPSKPSTSISGLASSILRDTEFSNVRSKEFSVANNPTHSDVYKSIFDTHKSANKKLKSNWVTCNPQYY